MSAYLLALLVLFFDQLSKVLVEIYMQVPGRSVVVVEFLELFNFTFVKNIGAAWGILPGHRALFVVVALVVTAGCIWIIHKFSYHVIKLPVALILGGGMGNMLDRLFLRSGVVDFVDMGIYSYRWPAFNVADIALSVGVIWLGYLILTGSCPLENYLFDSEQ
ncbi:MAG: signal peptidase II [bacterium]